MSSILFFIFLIYMIVGIIDHIINIIYFLNDIKTYRNKKLKRKLVE